MTEGLRVTGIAKRYGATLALDGVDLAVRPGEVLALLGENGAGKSTLMNVLSGEVQPDEGAMWLDDAPYAPGAPLDARRRGVALIHQELSLCPHLSVTDNVLLGNEVARRGWIDRRAARARARALLDELPHPDIRPDKRLADLPLSARQIVEICRALAGDARVLLMDEPTSSLQGADVDRLFDLIRRLAGRGIAIIYISHFLEEVRQIADRYTVLRDGRSVGSGAIAGVTNEHLITLMVGRSSAGLFPSREHRRDGEVVLAVRGLAAPPRLRDASFALRRGEILGIAGLIGSGRTEMVRALYGLEESTAGVVEVHGGARPAHRATAERRVREGVGYVSEDRKGEGLALPMSIADNLCATRMPRLAAGVLDLGRQAAAGRAILIVSSYLPELFGLCDRLAVMCRGTLSPARPIGEWTPETVLATAIGEPVS